jgi:hypothetical protein
MISSRISRTVGYTSNHDTERPVPELVAVVVDRPDPDESVEEQRDR